MDWSDGDEAEHVAKHGECVDGECVKEDKMEYFEALEGYQVWFAHDQMENQAGVAEHE